MTTASQSSLMRLGCAASIDRMASDIEWSNELGLLLGKI
jgi:hypothetical protein